MHFSWNVMIVSLESQHSEPKMCNQIGGNGEAYMFVT